MRALCLFSFDNFIESLDSTDVMQRSELRVDHVWYEAYFWLWFLCVSFRKIQLPALMLKKTTVGLSLLFPKARNTRPCVQSKIWLKKLIWIYIVDKYLMITLTKVLHFLSTIYVVSALKMNFISTNIVPLNNTLKIELFSNTIRTNLSWGGGWEPLVCNRIL